jgi:hypothetical protein
MDFHIHLYGAGLFVEFKEGRLAGVEERLLTQEECALSIRSFQRLILGCESLDELEKRTGRSSSRRKTGWYSMPSSPREGRTCIFTISWR